MEVTFNGVLEGRRGGGVNGCKSFQSEFTNLLTGKKQLYSRLGQFSLQFISFQNDNL
jgi:hypothetical protein